MEPRSEHTYQAVLLHGQGSNGKSLVEEVFASLFLDDTSLADRLSSWRWVFLLSKKQRFEMLYEDLTAWFDVPSTMDLHAG